MKAPSRVRQMPVLRVVARAMVPVILLFGLYVQFHGDFGPGGGFQAGVIFTAGLIVFGLVFGINVLQQVVSVTLTERLMATGVLLYGAVGLEAMILGGDFLDYSTLDLFTFGEQGQHLGIILIEVGVGIAVAATTLRIFYAFVGYRLDSRKGAEAFAGDGSAPGGESP